MIECKLQSCIIALIHSAYEAAGIGGVRFIGSWQAPETESKGDRAVIAVAVSPRAYDTYSIPHCDFAVSVAIAARSELFEDGEDISDFAAPLVDLLDGWQFDINQFAADVTLEGEFMAAGVRMDGGAAPILDRDSGNVTASFGFTVRGHVVRGEP